VARKYKTVTVEYWDWDGESHIVEIPDYQVAEFLDDIDKWCEDFEVKDDREY
jgi:hypothetical protein